MSRITFNIAAKCDKAGRAQNQDNYWVCPNLDKIGDTSSVGNDSDIELSSKGALLVVADGMGGMKSGEKASEFVIEGIKSKFSNIPTDVLSDDNAIIAFIKNAIIESDKIIKSYAKDHRESEGMGSTIVLLWLLGEKAYCGWCGDSRIYCYNPQNSLVRLSHDHSYVQSLVDEGKITEEEAFDHPDGNIITRSLGDSGEAANPETKIYPIHRRDVFMLCSDGLCGLLNDEQIENILADNCTSSEDALKALWTKGQQEGWSDNATIEVACITDGGVTPTRKAAGYDEGKPKSVVSNNKPIKKDTNVMPNFWQTNKQYIMILAIVAIVAICIIWFFSRDKKTGGSSNQEFNVEQTVENDQTTVTGQNSGESGTSHGGTSNGGNQGGGSYGGNSHGGSSHGGTSNGGNQGGGSHGGNSHGGPSHGGTSNGGNQGGGSHGGNSHGGPSHGGTSNGGNQGGGNHGGMYSDEPPAENNSVGPRQEYLDLLRRTNESIKTVKVFINNALKRTYFTKEEEQFLKDFIANTQTLSSLPDAKKLDNRQQSILSSIQTESSNATNFLKKYPTLQPNQHYDDSPDRGVGNDDNGNQINTNPIYINIEFNGIQ